MSKDIPSADDYEELILSARYGDVEDLDAFVMRFGVEKGDPKGQLSQCDDRGNTALHMASANGHQVFVSKIVHLLAPTALSLHNHQGNTPLHWAALNGHLEVVKILVENKADIKALNIVGRSALYEASDNEKESVVDYLLEHGAIEVGDIPDDEGDENEDKAESSTPKPSAEKTQSSSSEGMDTT